MKLSAAELSTLWLPPTAGVGERVQRVLARWIDAPARAFINPNDPRNLTLGLGQRSDGTWAPVGIPYADLRYILHVTAPMGRGKSEWLKNLFCGLLRAGAGFMALDCKGTDLVNGTIPLIPLERERDVIILDLGGTTVTGEDLRASMNLLSPAFGRGLGLDYSKLASTVLQVFATLDPRFNEAVGIKQFATMGMLALLEGEPRASMLHLIRFFGDGEYRAEICKRVGNIQVRDFWERRFDNMPDSQRASLAAFERRLDQLLSYPELAALLVAPGCSIDLRRMMDHHGILLAGIRATEGQIAAIAGTLLLTQMTIAALSRTNLPETQRPDWPVIIDEAQIVFAQNPGMAAVIFSQLRAMHIGTTVVHQNLGQLAAVMDDLAGNAQNRVILGAEALDAQSYGAQFRSLGLGAGDFMHMPTFEQQYLKLYGCGNLFAARMLPVATPLEEPPPPPVYVNWRTVAAPARNSEEQAIDEAIARFGELARVRPAEAVQRLGQLPEGAFDLYCARTKAHREAQRQFIIDNPGCIPLNGVLSESVARAHQKEQRIRTLSALGAGVPRLETEALQWRLLMAAREASERQMQRATEQTSRRVGGKTGRRHAPAPHPATPALKGGNPLGVVEAQPAPTLDQLIAERGRRRAADDVVEGLEALR